MTSIIDDFGDYWRGYNFLILPILYDKDIGGYWIDTDHSIMLRNQVLIDKVATSTNLVSDRSYNQIEKQVRVHSNRDYNLIWSGMSNYKSYVLMIADRDNIVQPVLYTPISEKYVKQGGTFIYYMQDLRLNENKDFINGSIEDGSGDCDEKTIKNFTEDTIKSIYELFLQSNQGSDNQGSRRSKSVLITVRSPKHGRY